MQETIKEIKALIHDDKIREVITATNGTRKVTIKLKSGCKLFYYGEVAREVLITTNRY